MVVSCCFPYQKWIKIAIWGEFVPFSLHLKQHGPSQVARVAEESGGVDELHTDGGGGLPN